MEDHRWAKRQKEEDELRQCTDPAGTEREVCLWAGLAEHGFAKTCPVIDQPGAAEHDLLTRPGGKSLKDLQLLAKN